MFTKILNKLFCIHIFAHRTHTCISKFFDKTFVFTFSFYWSFRLYWSFKFELTIHGQFVLVFKKSTDVFWQRACISVSNYQIPSELICLMEQYEQRGAAPGWDWPDTDPNPVKKRIQPLPTQIRIRTKKTDPDPT